MYKFLIKVLLNTVFLLSTFNAFSQTTQNGKTEEYNGREAHKPLGQVELTVRDASSTISDNKGNFKLKFLTLKPGDKVTIRNIDRDIKKEGYEVFNKDALEQWVISNSKTTFSIVLCKIEAFKALKDKWNATSSASYKKQWENKKAALKRQLDAGELKLEQYRNKMLELEDQYYAQLDNLDNYIDRFARIDLSKMDKQDSLIVEKIEAGQIDEVIKAYEQQKNLDKYLKTQNDISKIQESKRKLSNLEESKTKEADAYLSKIKQEIDALYLAGGIENIHKIDSILFCLASKDTLRIGNCWAYAQFLERQHEFAKAEYWFKKSFNYNLGFDDRCTVMHDLATLYVEQGNYDKGYKISKALLDSLDAKMVADSIKFMAIYVPTLEAIAVCYSDKGRYDEAEKTLLKEISLCSAFVGRVNDEDNDVLMKCKTDATNNLSIIYVNQGSFSKGVKLLKAIVPEAKKYAEEKQTISTFIILAGLEKQLGTCYMYNQQLDSAEVYLKTSVDLFEKLYTKDEKLIAPYLSPAYNNLCVFYYYNGKTTDAFKYAEKALETDRKMVQNGARTFIELYCNDLNNEGYLYYLQKNYTNAEKYISEAKSKAESLYNDYPDVYCRTYSFTLINLFTVFLEQDKLAECDKTYDIMCKVTEETHQKMGAGFDESYKIYKEQVTLYNQKKQTPTK